MLIGKTGDVLSEKAGAGIRNFTDPDAIAAACFSAIHSWTMENPHLPVIMAGMVGSNIGWRQTAYAPAPASVDDLIDYSTFFTIEGTSFTIVAGINTVGSSGIPDVMRGEETQIFGTASDAGEALYCLPGTHSKWVTVSSGKIRGFHTALTGELTQLLGEHSILLQPKRMVAASVNPDFTAGVILARDADLGLESLLFTVRSQQISGTLSPAMADSYMAGLIIGCEIRSALARHETDGAVRLIGAPHLTGLYQAALQIYGRQSEITDGRTAVSAGLRKIYDRLSA